MRIKRFNELFDSDEIKDLIFSQDPGAEIEFIKKDFTKYGDIEYDFKISNLETLLLKISNFHHPFMSAFIDASETENGTLEFSTFDLLVRFNEQDKSDLLVLASEKYFLILSVKVVNNKFDIELSLADRKMEKEVISLEEENLTFNDVVNIIDNEYITTIKNYGFRELLDYNAIRNLEAYN